MRKMLLALLLFCFGVAAAQPAATGNYPFATFETPGFDSIDVGNLNIRFNIPVVVRQGRGLPFNYSLQYEGLVWVPAASPSGGTVWTADPAWGFQGMLNGTGLKGYMTHTETRAACPRPPGRSGAIPPKQVLRSFLYHDEFGATHSFDYTFQGPCPASEVDDGYVTGDGHANDNSGYTLDVNDTSRIFTRSGMIIHPALSATGQDATSITDSNGNQITSDTSGVFTDTTGTTALSISGSSPRVFTYPVTLQSNQTTTSANTTLSYASYTVRTNFQCSGIIEYGSSTVPLPDRVTFADGSFYAFTYEGTQGATDGAVTGRLASLTLPTGGVINYTYSSGCNGTGISPDGTPSTLTRSTNDGTRTYVRAAVNDHATTTVLQDEKNNQTIYAFTVDANTGRFLATRRKVYQGGTNGTPLFEQAICYNGSSAPCDSTVLSLPISEMDSTVSYNGIASSVIKNTYDPDATLLTQTIVADANGNQLKKTTTSYNSLGEPSSYAELDASNATYMSVTYGYDENALTGTTSIPQHTTPSNTGSRGNLTSTHVSTGNGTLDTSTVYYDTGQVVSTTASDGGVTSYGYDGTQSFTTSTTLPGTQSGANLTSSAQYDTSTAAPLSTTGLNSGETTTVNHYDSRMRAIDVTSPSGSNVTATINGPGWVIMNQTLDGNRTGHYETYLDPYGRLSRSNRFNGQSNNAWYQVDNCYDASGLLQFQSAPYQGNGLLTPKHCSGAGTTYQYDALGRTTASSNSDGTATTSYFGRAVKTTDVNQVSRITQYDLLGRISAVCELSGTPLAGQAPVDCGLDIGGTGFLTTYGYSLAAHSVAVYQGSQSRSFQTDNAGRLINTTEPERGTTTYTYAFNSTGLQTVRTRSKANQTDPGVKTNTTTQYDRLGRIQSVSYDDGLTPNKSFFYDTNPASQGWTAAPAYPKGRLVAASNGANARSQFSYAVDGSVAWIKQCGPSICGSNQQESRPTLQYVYDLSGAITGIIDGSSGYIQYGRSAAGETTSVNNLTYVGPDNPGSLLSNVVNAPTGPLSWALGNGLQGVQSYDSLGRPNATFVCNGSSQGNCTGGQKLYGMGHDISGTRVTHLCDSILNQCGNASYDDLNRLTGLSTDNPSASQSYTYSYDRWGNRTSANGTTYSFNSANQQTNNGYDAVGNQLTDASHSYTFDAEGKLLQVDGGTTARYVYDALDQRVRVMAHGEDKEYQFDQFRRQQSTWQVAGNAGVQGRIYWDGGLLAHRGYAGQTFFHHSNLLGTERLRTNYQGLATSTVTSGPYGENFTQQSNNLGNPIDEDSNYTGQDRDAETQTEHFSYRQYAENSGRWMSPDPLTGSYHVQNPQSFNRYAYLRNSPLIGVDFLGLDMLCAPVWADSDDGDGGVIATQVGEDCIDEGGGGPSGGDSGFVGGWDWGVGGVGDPNAANPPHTCIGATCGRNDPDPTDGTQTSAPGGSPTAPAAPAPNSSVMFAQKGERSWTSKPDKPLKGVRPVVKGGKVTGWTTPSPDGKRVPKSLDWGRANGLNENDPKWVAMGLLLEAAGVAVEAAEGLEWWELLVGAAAF